MRASTDTAHTAHISTLEHAHTTTHTHIYTHRQRPQAPVATDPTAPSEATQGCGTQQRAKFAASAHFHEAGAGGVGGGAPAPGGGPPAFCYSFAGVSRLSHGVSRVFRGCLALFRSHRFARNRYQEAISRVSRCFAVFRVFHGCFASLADVSRRLFHTFHAVSQVFHSGFTV